MFDTGCCEAANACTTGGESFMASSFFVYCEAISVVSIYKNYLINPVRCCIIYVR